MPDISEINDKTLVAKLKNNEVEAFDAIFNRYNDKLYRFSLSMLKNEEDAREIVQEAFIRIWEKRESIDSSKSFMSFLFSISYHLVIDQLRLRLKDQNYRRYIMKYFDESVERQVDAIDCDTIGKEIAKAVEDLPEKRKQIYTLSREKGFSHKEIAGMLGIKIKTVENQINLALKHIKTRLGEDIIMVLLFMALFK